MDVKEKGDTVGAHRYNVSIEERERIAMGSNPDQDFVLKTIKSRDVHFVRFWFSDVLGNVKSFAVIPSELDNVFEEGMGFDGSCVEGFSRTQEAEVLAYPDASTFHVLPWRPDSDAVARMFCDIKNPSGEPFAGDSREVLRRMVDKASDMGYEYNVGAELEYFYFQDSDHTEVLDRGGYFDLTSLDSASDLRRDTVLTLEKMGIPVKYSHHESGPSQHEIDLRDSDALSMADAVMTYKLVVKEIAMKHEVYASFMPKPMTDAPGSGMHVHQSLFDHEGHNVFFDPKDAQGYGLSKTAKHYIAGLLKYAPEFCAVTNQYVNSYKRLVADREAPTYINWAKGNQSSLVRVPQYRVGKERACRVELRNPDPATNPYLAFAVMLGAGLKGIQDELPLQEASEAIEATCPSHKTATHEGLRTLPKNLGEAIELFDASDLMKEILGDHIHSYFVQAKRAEWNAYQSYVSSWERDRYLAIL